jgi:enoyl-CoA hydratase/carnithine racemase
MPDVLYEKHDRYAIFTMNRPERLNALGGNLRNEMREAVDDFNADPAMRVGILTGAGRAFSAGMDLRENADRANRGEAIVAQRVDSVVPRLLFSGSPKPFIAAINGLAVGGGLEQALDCDMRIIASDAYVGLFEVKRGILAGYAIHHLPRMIGAAATNHILLTGDRVSPEQALQWGIVSEVVEPDRLMPRAIELAQMIAANAPLSIQGTKKMIQAWRMAKIDDSYRLGQEVSKPVLESEDIKEGSRAFAEKREPHWQGR